MGGSDCDGIVNGINGLVVPAHPNISPVNHHVIGRRVIRLAKTKIAGTAGRQGLLRSQAGLQARNPRSGAIRSIRVNFQSATIHRLAGQIRDRQVNDVVAARPVCVQAKPATEKVIQNAGAIFDSFRNQSSMVILKHVGIVYRNASSDVPIGSIGASEGIRFDSKIAHYTVVRDLRSKIVLPQEYPVDDVPVSQKSNVIGAV